MNYQWIILILLIVLSIVIVFWTYFNHKNNQRLKNVANEFTKNILAMLVIEKKWILIPGNLTNDLVQVKNKVKTPEELAKVISAALKICFVNFIWIFLEKVVEKYTSQQEAKRNLLFRDVNYGSEKKNDSCFKNSIANLITNWELEFYQLNDNTLELISLAQYFQQLNQIKKEVFIKFNINFMNKKYSFVTWTVGKYDFELQDIYNILKINKIEFVNSQMLLENYYYHVFQNHSISSLENLETTYHLCSTNLATKISLLEQNKKLTNTEKGNQMILILNLIQLEVAYQALKEKMLLEFEFDSNVAKEG